MTELYLGFLDGFAAGDGFRMEICELAPVGLRLEAKTPADRRAIAAWRNRLADLFGYRHPDHDSYVFHITLAYMTDWFDDAVLGDWQKLLDECLEDIRAAVPVVELNPPAFCAFTDMNHFKELLVLGQKT